MMSFAYLSIRLFAIYLVVNSLVNLVQLGFTWPIISDQMGPYAAAFPLLFALFAVVVGVIIWFLAGPIARLALPPGQRPADEIDLQTNDWTRLVVVIFGLYLIVTSIPSIASLMVLSVQQSSVMAETSIKDMITGDRSNWSQLTYSGTRFLLGLAMVIGRTGVVRFVMFLKSFALGDKPPPNQTKKAPASQAGTR